MLPFYDFRGIQEECPFTANCSCYENTTEPEVDAELRLVGTDEEVIYQTSKNFWRMEAYNKTECLTYGDGLLQRIVDYWNSGTVHLDR